MRIPFDLSVYFVADPSVCAGRDIRDVVRAAIDGCVSMVQYRNKSGENARSEAIDLLQICRDSSIPFLVNDDVTLAQEIGADGVHIGQGDMPPEQARQILGNHAIIGLTAFTPEQIIKAVDVDYIGTGPFYPTKTEKGKPVLGAQGFAKLAAVSSVPVVGIGGIEPENAGAVIEAGAAGVAMMRGISEAPCPRAAAENFVTTVRDARAKSDADKAA